MHDNAPAPGNSRKSINLAAVVCAVLIVVTFVLAEMKPWAKKPANAGVCPENPVDWQRTAIKGKLASAAGPDFQSRSFTIQQGAHWDDKNRLWVVPFRTPEQAPGNKDYLALISCTSSVDIEGGGT